jgi:tRNA pseudouridine55 synthase
MKKVLIFGSFDIIHPGHMFVIEQAKKFGQPFVCLALDQTIEKVKGHLPFYPLAERQKQLESLGLTVYPGSTTDKYEVFRRVGPDIILLGHDQDTFVAGLEEVIRNEKFQTEIIRLPEFQRENFQSNKLRKLFASPDAGFLLINKPVGEPSFRTISQLRKITGQKQIGFAGTLDPAASGLLAIGINDATKLLDLWHGFTKEYVAEVTLGSVSTTYDREGTITPLESPFVKGRESVSLERSLVEKELHKFVGTIQQIPPMYSAKSVDGKRLYELAREGKEVERKPATVTIHSLEILEYSYPVLKLKVVCSTGTYIRSLAHDLGQALGVGAYLSALERTAIGPYRLEQALPISQITSDSWRAQLISKDLWLRYLNEQKLSPAS